MRVDWREGIQVIRPPSRHGVYAVVPNAKPIPGRMTGATRVRFRNDGFFSGSDEARLEIHPHEPRRATEWRAANDKIRTGFRRYQARK